MLLRFGFSNFKSVKDYQEISFIASSISDECADLLSSESVNENILPSLAIYGGNATGKSNLLRALAFVCSGVRASHVKGSAGGGVPREYFLLDSNSKNIPSLFDCDFILDGVRFHYGFSVDNEQILEEWLYAYPKKYKQVWFHRNINEKEQFYFGKELKGRNRTIEELTRKNSLFISSAAQNNHEQLTPIYEYFSNNIEFDFGRGDIHPYVLERYLGDENERNWLINFLSAADIGIVNVKVEYDDKRKKNVDHALLDAVASTVADEDDVDVDEVKKIVLKNLSKKISVEHACGDGSTVALKLDDESLGTRKLIAVLGPIYEAIRKGKTLVIDELDTSMHPLLSRKIIKLFQDRKTNHNSAQLLFTTHDTNLLAGCVLRRDQVWFTEKDENGSTNVFPLTDVKTRKGDNIENGYLQGRYGAIPYLGNLSTLFNYIDD